MGGDGDGAVLLVWDKRHPIDDLRHALEVVGGCHMGNTVLVHNLCTA